MSNFNPPTWEKVTYVNESTPHITADRLNKNEEILEDIMGELNSYNSTNLKDFVDYAMNNNIKVIHNFDISTDFTGTGSLTIGNMYEQTMFGINAVKIQDLNNSSGSIGIYDSFSSIDLTTFPSGASSSTSDYIEFAFYVTDSTKFNTILIRLGDDDSNCYYKYVDTWYTGWNIRKYRKSEFGTDGTPSGWDDITFLRIYINTKVNASSDYVAFAMMWLARKNYYWSYASSLYVTNGSGAYNSFMYIQGLCNAVSYFDKRIGRKGIGNATVDWTSDMIQVMDWCNCFSFRCEAYCKNYGDPFAGAALLWYVNDTNYIHIAPQGDETNNFVMIQYLNGSYSTIASSANFDSAIEPGDRYEIWAEKTPDNIVRARIEVDGMTPLYVEAEIDIPSTSDGVLGIIQAFYQSPFIVTDFVANNNPAVPLPAFSNSFTKCTIKHFQEYVIASTTFIDDDELKMKLPSNGLFEVRLVLIYKSTSAVPDIKVKWDVSGDYETISDGRVLIGAATGATSFTDIPLFMNNYAFGTSVPLGTVSGGEMPYHERILIKTGSSGCILQLQWAQNTSDSAYTSVMPGSYIKAIKL